MPFVRGFDTLGTDLTYDSGDYAGLLDKALAAAGWDTLQQDLRRRRAAGEAVGAGLAIFVEKSGLGPFDGVRATVDTSGAVEVVTGAASVGQGVETVVAQICADALGVDYRSIRVVHGQTDRIAFGMGAFASRVTVMTGEATRIAASNLRDKAIAAAASLLQSPPDALDVIDGKVVKKSAAPGPSVTLGEVARALAPAAKLLGEEATPGLSAEGWFESRHMTYPYGVHLAVVRVDRDSGAVAVERYLVAYDVGKAVNPMLVEGQIAGGVAQGLGGSLFEEFRYDARGEPLAVTFADYLIPTAREVPAVETLITEDAPSPLNTLGLKGAGEGGANPVGAAIASAIDNALGLSGAVTELPVTPQRLRAMLKNSGQD
jgi:aerobic carbon-monoxide dehydrogenase large subunit